MLDNQLLQIILPVISQGLINQGVLNIPIKQAYQPTQQGVDSTSTIYITKINDAPYGALKRTDVWDEVNQINVHTELQPMMTTFQIEALAIQTPASINSLTASDLVKTVRAILQSDLTRTTFFENSVGLFRIDAVRNPYFVDDKDRFEASPSFDFTVNHQDVTISTTPILDTITVNCYNVGAV